MKRIFGLILAVVAAGGLATVSAARSTEHSGELHVTKTCSEYTGAAGSHCTIRSSNIDAIQDRHEGRLSSGAECRRLLEQ